MDQLGSDGFVCVCGTTWEQDGRKQGADYLLQAPPNQDLGRSLIVLLDEGLEEGIFVTGGADDRGVGLRAGSAIFPRGPG